MINDKGKRIWTFRRSFIFPDRNVCVDHMGLDYEKDKLFLYVYNDEHYRPQYTVDPETGKLLKRDEDLGHREKYSKVLLSEKKIKKHKELKNIVRQAFCCGYAYRQPWRYNLPRGGDP
ncbi:MAG: hypothetical protein K2H90_09100 [Oscillospiraceae bacterium]|nr:hypothetical protein [Oscillospiraceae bacterium]